RDGAHEDVSVRNVAFGEHADVERVAIALDALDLALLATNLGNLVAAVGLRDEAVERRAHRGEALWAVDAQVSGVLVQLVLDTVGGDDLNERLHLCRGGSAR